MAINYLQGMLRGTRRAVTFHATHHDRSYYSGVARVIAIKVVAYRKG